MDDVDREIERIDLGGNAWEDSEEGVELRVKRPLDKAILVEFSADEWDQLYAQARRMGMGPTALAKDWLLDRLRAASTLQR